MRSLILLVLVVALAAASGAWLVREVKNAESSQNTFTVPEESTVPRIDEIRKMSKLVVLDLKISFYHTEKLESGALIGLKVGAVKAKFAVRGDVVVATDLSKARYKDVDEARRVAVLELAAPQPERPRVNHERTQVLYEREGVWTLLPSHRPEEKVTSDGLRNIQRLINDHAQKNKHQYIKEAKQHVLNELGRLYKELGWELEVIWDDGTGPGRAGDT